MNSKFFNLLKLFRLKQWIKNLFVFAPLVFSGKFLSADYLCLVVFSAFLFSIASSATYIINDIHDIDHDRLHPKKSKTRPLAAREVSMPEALALLVLLYAILICSWFLIPKVLIVILIYIVINFAYTFILKHQPVIDIFTIAVGFVLRVYAGAVAIDVPVSSWMFITTLCLALYLAAVKRRQELTQSGSEGRKVLQKYTVSLVSRYAEMSATGALLFYSMFVMSAKPELVITVPVVLFGLFRYWFVVEALDGGESPTDALLVDRQLLLTVLIWVALCVCLLWPVQG